MKNVFKKILFIFLSVWHCAMSLISPTWLLFIVAFFADINNDDGYAATFIGGSFLLIFWLLCFLPSFIYLTGVLKKKRKILSIIPISAFIIFAFIGCLAIGFPSIGEVLSHIFII